MNEAPRPRRAIRPPEPLINADDVAAILGMTTDYVYALCRRGAIPFRRFGRTYRFRPSEIERWLEDWPRGRAA
jgi:excisionase family DNA binding protein